MPLEMGARVDKIGINAQYAKICQESKGKIDYDKSFIHLPRHSSFTIMQGFAKWGNTGQNVSGNRINTTV